MREPIPLSTETKKTNIAFGRLVYKQRCIQACKELAYPRRGAELHEKSISFHQNCQNSDRKWS